MLDTGSEKVETKSVEAVNRSVSFASSVEDIPLSNRAQEKSAPKPPPKPKSCKV